MKAWLLWFKLKFWYRFKLLTVKNKHCKHCKHCCLVCKYWKPCYYDLVHNKDIRGK